MHVGVEAAADVVAGQHHCASDVPAPLPRHDDREIGETRAHNHGLGRFRAHHAVAEPATINLSNAQALSDPVVDARQLRRPFRERS